MEGGGSFMSGDAPDDPEGHGDDTGPAARAWLPPEDRLWRHPSEIASHGLPRSPLTPFDASGDRVPHRRLRRPSLFATVAGVATVATATAVALLLADTSGTGTSRGASSAPADAVTVATSSEATAPLVSHDVEKIVKTLRPSLVELQPLNVSGAHMTGVVLPGSALVVTAASAVAGASEVDVVTADGKRHRGSVVGSDAHAGVAVVSTDGGLVPASFADEPVGPGDFALVACLCTAAPADASRHDTSPDAAMSTVTQVGTSVSVDSATSLVDAIEAEMPLGRAAWGGVLVDGHGRVLGVLDAVTTGSDSDPVGIFVPAPLAEGVAQELAQTRNVRHGWLGVQCSDGPLTGATVTKVMAGSPAAHAGLRTGDVVVAVGSHPIASFADLQERLYTLPPGQSVQLSVARNASDMAMSVTLADSPGS